MTEAASEHSLAQPGHQAEEAVFGYIRREDPDEIEIALLRKDMGKYCQANGCHPSAVFVTVACRPR